MNKFKTILATVLLGVTAILLLPVANAGNKVEVCHLPPGNPSNFHTISVNQNALPAHLAHGDIEGTCESNGETLCDDGDFCTIDGFEEGTEICAAPAPVNCDDTDPFTTDSCVSASGCENVPIDPTITCNDGNACTLDEYVPGSSPLQCTNANSVICNDNDVTTRDSCNINTGCIFAPIEEPQPTVTAQPQTIALADDSPVIITLVGNAGGILPGQSLIFTATDGANGTITSGPNLITPADVSACSISLDPCASDLDCTGGETCTASITPAATTATVEYTPIPPAADDSFNFTVEFNSVQATAAVTIFGPGVDDPEDPPETNVVTATNRTVDVTELGSVSVLLKGAAPTGTGNLTFNILTGPSLGNLGAIVPLNPTAVFAQFGTCSITTTQGCDANDDCPGAEICDLPLLGFTGQCDVSTTLSCRTGGSSDINCPAGETCLTPPVRSARVTYNNTAGTAPTTDAFTFEACETNCSAAATVNINIEDAAELAPDKEVSGDLNQPIPFSIP